MSTKDEQGVSVAEAISARKTVKVLAETPMLELSGGLGELEGLLVSAGWAPFHKMAHKQHLGKDLDAIEPWRAYVFEGDASLSLREYLMGRGDESKVPKMLATARAMVMFTWLPNPAERSLVEGELFEGNLANMEHLAAASCAVQNFLLAATSEGIDNFWSTGGKLRHPNVMEDLGIPKDEILLGAIFLFHPQDRTEDSDVPFTMVHSKLREKRSSLNQWAKWSSVQGEA
jgi:nitroreductase